MTNSKAWKHKFNPIRALFEAFFCTTKNGDKIKEFSAKKFFAFCFSILALHSDVTLVMEAQDHWISALTGALKAPGLGVSDGTIGTIIVTIIGTMNGMAVGALAVYGWAKSKGAA